jgi:hypothetical protein
MINSRRKKLLLKNIQPKYPMAHSTYSDSPAAHVSHGVNRGNGIYRIIGITCILGFCLDALILAIPLNPNSLEWQAKVIQSLADRSIILLMGLGLLMSGILDLRSMRKKLSIGSLGIALLLVILAFMAVWNSNALQQQTSAMLSQKTSQIEAQLQTEKEKAPPGTKITPEQMKQALDRLTAQSETVKQTAQTQILKTGISSAGNLILVSLALFALGRYGLGL